MFREGYYNSSLYSVRMRVGCVALLFLGFFLPAVICDGHLRCPDGRVCPFGTYARSDASEGVCDDSAANNNIRSQILSNFNGLLRVNRSQYFDRLRPSYVGQNQLYAADDCDEIKRAFPDNASGYYWLRGGRVYCNFDLSVDTNKMGWERAMYNDLSNMSHTCPGDMFRLVQPPEDGNGRYCVKTTNGNGCDSVVVSPGTREFSRVYGRIIGVQIGTGDISQQGTINDPYLDGVSLTANVGTAREHVWSFMSYTTENENGCPCSAGSPNTPLPFIGDDYFCESGSNTLDVPGTQSFLDDPLWDGELCRGMETACCPGGSPRSPPWFYKEFPAALPEGTNIELRICTDQAMDDESVGVRLIELYVQ